MNRLRVTFADPDRTYIVAEAASMEPFPAMFDALNPDTPVRMVRCLWDGRNSFFAEGSAAGSADQVRESITFLASLQARKRSES